MYRDVSRTYFGRRRLIAEIRNTNLTYISRHTDCEVTIKVGDSAMCGTRYSHCCAHKWGTIFIEHSSRHRLLALGEKLAWDEQSGHRQTHHQ